MSDRATAAQLLDLADEADALAGAIRKAAEAPTLATMHSLGDAARRIAHFCESVAIRLMEEQVAERARGGQ